MDAAKGSHTLMMSADLETDPNIVPEFIEMAKKYPEDMTTASRWIVKDAFKGYSKIKLILNFFFQKIFAVFYGTKLTDITFGYRMGPTKLFQSIQWEELKHPFFLETALKPLRLGVPFHEGVVHSHESFYHDENEAQSAYWSSKGVLGADMESAALLTIARLRGMKAASILNNVVLYGADTADAIGDYVDGADAAARGERDEIRVALEAFVRLDRLRKEKNA